MKNLKDNRAEINEVLNQYFNGIFNGDANLLRSIFHPKTLVAGDINGVPYFKELDQYLEGVATRKSPHELGEIFRMEILSVEINNAIAIAKVRVPIFDYNYFDLLSLSIFNGKWVIMNKLLTHVNHSEDVESN